MIPSSPDGCDRRSFVGYLSALGLGATQFPSLLWDRIAHNEITEITAATIAEAAKIAGLEFTAAERELMLEGVKAHLESYAKLRSITVPNDVPPALTFSPSPQPSTNAAGPAGMRYRRHTGRPPPTAADLAFAPVTRLAELVRSRQVSAVELTELYLDRLRRYGPVLECVVSLTEVRAMDQAHQADREIERGRYRGPLHGIPWGAKDLLAARGYRTTWGAKPYEHQRLAEDATVIRRLDDAGAVLVAKLTLGALAWGDVWYGGRTRNPWNLEQGSSGSSAGPGAATAAGLVGFSVGSETWGSIVSPSTRCGVTGHRPTFGTVSRHGAMALAWSMDKLGPMCRSAEDCALVFNAIRGPDGHDPTVRDAPFAWDHRRDATGLRVGYLHGAFDVDYPSQMFDVETLEVLRTLGVEPMPLSWPDTLPVEALSIILSAEAAAAFDDLTRSGRDDLLVRQIENAWPNAFRQSRLIPAVEYIQANRVRTMLMGELDRVMTGIDVLVAPTFGGNQLLATNLTGHPAVSVPNGFREDGTPVSITFVGQRFQDADILTLARAYQDVTDFHVQRPARFS